MMLIKRNRLELTDICCRIISDGPVTLEERVWMHDLIERSETAKELAGALLCPYKI